MRDAGGGPAAPPVVRDAALPATPPHPASRIPHPEDSASRISHPASPPVPPSASPPEQGPLTLERLRALWPRIVDDARASSPLLGALLAQTEVAGLDGATVAIRLLDTNPVHAEGIERQRAALASLIGRYVAVPVRVQFAPGGAAAMGLASAAGGVTAVTNGPPRPARLTEESARQERLRNLRAKDPSLDAAVEALDLELLE